MKSLPPQNPSHFHEIIRNHRDVLMCFSKDNCPGCKMLDASLSKIYDQMSDQILLVTAKLELVGEELFKAEGLRQTPTLIAYRNGQEVARLSGFTPPAQLLAWIQTHFPTTA